MVSNPICVTDTGSVGARTFTREDSNTNAPTHARIPTCFVPPQTQSGPEPPESRSTADWNMGPISISSWMRPIFLSVWRKNSVFHLFLKSEKMEHNENDKHWYVLISYIYRLKPVFVILRNKIPFFTRSSKWKIKQVEKETYRFVLNLFSCRFKSLFLYWRRNLMVYK